MKAKKNTNYTRLIIVVSICLAAMVLLMLLNSIEFSTAPLFMPEEAETDPIYFREVDEDYDPFDDEEYLEKNRFITYTDPPYTTLIDEYNNEHDRLGYFFLEYFDSLIKGDAEKYNTFFTDDYYSDKNNKPYEFFTKQPIYDIEIEKTSEYTFEEGEYAGITRYVFKISYKIFRNDGTFRHDMPSRAAVPRIVEILDDGTDIKINSITKSISVK